MFYDYHSDENYQALVACLKSGSGVTACIGAGLSYPQFGSWSDLHEAIQESAGISPRWNFDAALAPVDFGIFRSRWGESELFSFIKDRFGRPIPEVLHPYKLLIGISGFATYITTNYDDNLASAAASTAAQPRITAYPDLKPNHEYVYLHGRASSARNLSDLVLCDDDYGIAYEGQQPATRILEHALLGDVLFIGTSLKDPDTVRILQHRKRLQPPRGTKTYPNPFILIATGHSEDQDVLSEHVARETLRMEANGLRPIWYKWDKQHSQLRAILVQLRHDALPAKTEPIFLEQASELREAAAAARPSEIQIERVSTLVRSVPELARFFFSTATSPDWYDILKPLGVITAVMEPQADGQYIRARFWAAAPYIKAIAPYRPDAVVELVQELATTENWNVQTALTEAAIDLPAELLSSVLPALRGWLRPKYAHMNLVDHYLMTMFTRLVAEGHVAEALEVLPLFLEARDTGHWEIQLTIEPHDFPRIESTVDKLISEEPREVYLRFKAAISNVLTLLDASRHSYFWRPAIEDNDENEGHFHKSEGFLVEGMRDSFNTWVRSEHEDSLAEFDELASSSTPIFRRIALHAATVTPTLIPRLPEATFSESVFRGQTYHELMELLRQRFGDLTPQQAEAVHRSLETGPPQTDAETEENHEQYVQDYRRRLLNVIPPMYLTEQERSWSAELLGGSPAKNPTFLYSTREPWGSMEPPEELPSIGDEGPESYLAALRQSRHGWEGLGTLVESEPHNVDKLIAALEPSDVSNAWKLFSQLDEQVKAGHTISWLPIVELGERMDGKWGELARLLRDGMAQETAGIPQDLLDRAAVVTIAGLNGTFTPLDSPEPPSDYIHNQLNSDSGQLAEAIGLYIWRKARREDHDLPSFISEHLSKALTDGWGGLELRTAMGEYIGVFNWMEAGFIEHPALCPLGDDLQEINARRAFLAGVLVTARVSKDVLRTCRAGFGIELATLEDTGRQFSDTYGIDRLIEYVVIGWLVDVEGYELQAGLLGELIDKASDERRYHIVWYLESQLKASTGEFQEIVKAKMKLLFDTRTAAYEGMPVVQKSQEVAGLANWASILDLPLEEAEPQLQVIIDHIDLGIAFREILGLFKERASSEPVVTLRLFEHFVDGSASSDWFRWDTGAVRSTLLVLQDAAPGGTDNPSLQRIFNRLAVEGVIQEWPIKGVPLDDD